MKFPVRSKAACASSLSGAFVVATHVFLIFACIFCHTYFFSNMSFVSCLSSICIIIFIGTRMRALGNIVHECSHGTFVPSKRANEWIGHLLCLLEFSCFTKYKTSHLLHHRYLGNPIKDDDFKNYRIILSKLPQFFSRRNCLNTPLDPSHKKSTRWYILYATLWPGNWLRACLKSICFGKLWYLKIIYCVLLVPICTLLGYKLFILFLVIPFFTSYQALKIFSDMMDHDNVYFFPDMRYRSCNHYFSIKILNWIFFPRNDGYHLVHHLFPKEPTTAFENLHQMLLERDSFYSKHQHLIF